MSLGYDIAGALPGLRAEANSRMTETVTAGVFTDGTDPDTLEPTRVLAVEHYAGIGRIRWGSREVSNANGPSMPVAVQEPYLSVPFGSPLIHEGDEVHCAASSDPLLVGRKFTVSGSPVAGQVTAYRYPLEELG